MPKKIKRKVKKRFKSKKKAKYLEGKKELIIKTRNEWIKKLWLIKMIMRKNIINP